MEKPDFASLKSAPRHMFSSLARNREPNVVAENKEQGTRSLLGSGEEIVGKLVTRVRTAAVRIDFRSVKRHTISSSNIFVVTGENRTSVCTKISIQYAWLP